MQAPRAEARIWPAARRPLVCIGADVRELEEAASGVNSQTPARFFARLGQYELAPPSNLSLNAGVFGPFSPAWR